jgi:hypothetical protein
LRLLRTELQCRTGESSAWVLAMKGPDAPWLASLVSQPTTRSYA